jgi:hypothetical protein
MQLLDNSGTFSLRNRAQGAHLLAAVVQGGNNKIKRLFSSIVKTHFEILSLRGMDILKVSSSRGLLLGE